MSTKDILKELQALGQDNYKKMLMNNHGVKEPCFGVKIGDMKPIQKRIKKDYQLALDLYDTGIYDAMYLAGLIADDERMTQKDLQHWAEKANGGALPGTTVASVAAQSNHGWEMATEWIDSSKTNVAIAGWSTLSCLVALKDDSELDFAQLKQFIALVEKTIHRSPDAVRYAMNNFVISVGCYVESLTTIAIKAGERIGTVTADLGNNACKIPFAPDYIRKVQQRGSIGQKRKTVKC